MVKTLLIFTPNNKDRFVGVNQQRAANRLKLCRNKAQILTMFASNSSDFSIYNTRMLTIYPQFC